MKRLLFLLLLAFPVFAQTPNGGYTSPAGGGSEATTNSPSNAYYFSPNCGTLTNCTTIYDDALWFTDCTTNGTTLVTCPDALFKASDVGKAAYVTTLGQSNGLSFMERSSTVHLLPIATFNSSTSINLTAACGGVSIIGNAALFFGHPDGTTIATAMNAHCGNFIFPLRCLIQPNRDSLKIWADQPFGNVIPAGCNTVYSSMSGATPNASSVVFLIPVNFNWAGCTGK